MKKTYSKLSTEREILVLESGFLTSSIVEVDPDVRVEEFKDGFQELGADGFVVEFD